MTTTGQPALVRAAAGDGAAVGEVLDRYGGLVWSLARRTARSAGCDAEDLVQEIFLDVWRSAGRFDPGVSSEATFIAMIARRRLIDARRKASRSPAMAELTESAVVREAGAGPVESDVLHDDAREAAVAMRQLSEEQQRVLRLCIVQGLSHDKAAASTGLPLGTVKTHARRGLLRMRELLMGGVGRSGAGRGASSAEVTP